MSPFLTKISGDICSDNFSMSCLLNDYFTSVFTVDDENLPDFPVKSLQSLENLLFDEENVRLALKKIKPSISSGPDGISAFLLKKLSFSICLPLSMIFTSSYSKSCLPSQWKEAVVIPSNYRPISLCSVPCKLMESIINEKILFHLESKKLFSRYQFGFRKNTSCALQLLTCRNDWTKNLDENTVDVVYIDFCKAFDSVSHEKLLMKISVDRSVDPDVSGPCDIDVIQQHLAEARQIANDNINLAQSKSKEHYDRRSKSIEYEIGQDIMYTNDRKASLESFNVAG